jgi:hypothetical protein
VQPGTDATAAFLGGFIAGEGTFVRSGDPPTFRFAVGLGAADTGVCDEMLRFFACGRVHHSPRRKPHYDDEVIFVISALRDHLRVTIPFMDAHLPMSHKRTQYQTWRSQLLEYWEQRARRRRPCFVDGCELLRKAHGLCRHHLWAFRQE